MRNDGNDLALDHLGQPVIHRLRNAEIVEFHQQIPRAANAPALRSLECRLHVLKGEMKVTSEAQLRLWPDPGLQLLQESGQIGAIVEVSVVRMRRSYHVLDPILSRHAAHSLAGLPRFRSEE